MAGLAFWGGFPTKYVLDKLGAQLRDAYVPALDEPLPIEIRALVAQILAN
jgi:hypothetical protein